MTTAIDHYPTRRDGKPEWLDRKDPVVWSGNTPLPAELTRDQVEGFERDGYLFIEDVFRPDEIDTFRQELRRLVSDDELARSPEAITEPGSGVVRSIFRIHEISNLFRKLARDPRIANIARFILADDLSIHQSRVNMKPGFAGKEFYWHSDFETWHAEDGMPRMRAVSASIALTDNSEFNGPLMIIPGSHKTFITCSGKTPENNFQTSLKRQEIGVPDPESLTEMAARHGIVAPKGKAGSVLLFDCNVLHGSNSNITPYPRSNVFFVYNAASNPLVDPYCGQPPRPDYIAARDTTENF